jgi:TRAP-type transport system periplasmic protein
MQLSIKGIRNIAAVFIIFLSNCARAAEPYTIHLAHIGGPGSLLWISGEEYADRVAKLSRGTVRVALHPNSELGGDSVVIQKLLTGEADLAIFASVMSSIASEFGVFEMPFLVRDRDHVRRFRDTIMQSYLKPAAENKGYRALAMWELGFRHIVNNKRAIDHPGDLSGLKLRVPLGEWRIRMFRAYGAEPVPLDFKDILPGIEAGKIDGLEAPLDLIYSAHLERAQKYLTLSRHIYSPSFLVMGQERFQKLPVSVRAILEKAAMEMQDWVLRKGEELDAEFLGKLQPFLEVNEVDRLSFTIQSMPIYAEYTNVPVNKSLVRLLFESDATPLAPAMAR